MSNELVLRLNLKPLWSVLCFCLVLMSSKHSLFAQSCETGDARVAFDPVEDLKFVPADGEPIVLKAGKGGFAEVVSGTLPAEVLVPVSSTLRNRNAVAIRFKFIQTSQAVLRFITDTTIDDEERWVSVEPSNLTCAPIQSEAADLGETTLQMSQLATGPFQVFLFAKSGEHDVRLAGTFVGGLEYRLIFYNGKDKGPSVVAHLYRPLPGQGQPEPDLELKILPPGFNPATGCLGSAVDHLRDAIVAEKRAIAHVENLDQAVTQAVLQRTKNKVRPSPRDNEIVRKLIELSLAHLRCARKLVENDPDLTQTIKDLALSDIDRAIRLDEEAIELIETEVTGIANKDLQAVARLAQARLNLESAVPNKIDAAQRVSPGFVAPDLETGYSLGDALNDTKLVMLGRDEALRAAIGAYSEKVSKLLQVTQEEAEEGVKKILVSNTNPAHRTFLELVLLGEARALDIAAQKARREAELALEAEEMEKAERRRQALIARDAAKVALSVEQNAKAITKAVANTSEAVAPTKSTTTEMQQLRATRARLTKNVRELGKLNGTLDRRRQIIEDLGRSR